MPLKLQTADAWLRADVLARERILLTYTEDSLAEVTRKLAAAVPLPPDIRSGALPKLVADVQRQQAVLAKTVGQLRRAGPSPSLMDIATASLHNTSSTAVFRQMAVDASRWREPAPTIDRAVATFRDPLRKLLDDSSSFIAQERRALQANASLVQQQAGLAKTVGQLRRAGPSPSLMDIATASLHNTSSTAVFRQMAVDASRWRELAPTIDRAVATFRDPLRKLLDDSSSFIAQERRALQANASLVRSALQDGWRLNLTPALPRIDDAAPHRRLCAMILNAIESEDPEVLKWFVTEQLGLPVRYCTEVWLALYEGHWKQARQPVLYVLKVARRLHAHEAAKQASLFTPELLSLDAPSSTGHSFGQTVPDPRDPFASIEMAHTVEQATRWAGLSADACFLATVRCQHGTDVTRRDLPALLGWPKPRVEAALREFQRKLPRLQHILHAWRGSH